MVAELHSNSDASMFMSTADAEQFDVLAHLFDGGPVAVSPTAVC